MADRQPVNPQCGPPLQHLLAVCPWADLFTSLDLHLWRAGGEADSNGAAVFKVCSGNREERRQLRGWRTGSCSGRGSPPPSPPPTPGGGVCPARPGTGSGSLAQKSREKGAPGRRHSLGRQRAFCPGSLLPCSGLSSNT